MNKVEQLARDATSGRQLFLLDVPTTFDCPEHLSLATTRFVCLMAWDARTASVDEISRVARWLLDAGAVYICAWGPDCERVHDIIDEDIVGPNPNPNVVSNIITTWHANESLSAALDFTLAATWPDDAYVNDCGSTLAISIGSAEWAQEIRSRFLTAR